MTHPQPPQPYGQPGPHGSPYPPQQPYGQPQQPYGQPPQSYAYAPPGPHVPPGPYAPPGPHGQGYPPHGAAAPGGCEVCGAGPAVAATVRAHQGMIIIMRTVTRRGVFCRTCGLAVYRRMTSNTLVTGWWGLLSFFFTPFVVLGNVFGARAAFRRLPEPYGALRPPLDPGRRVLLRAPALLVLVPLTLLVAAVPVLALIGLLAGSDGDGGRPGLSVGDCVENTVDWPDQALRKVDCGSASAEYRVEDGPSCGPGDYLLRPEYVTGSPGRPGHCVKPL